MSNTGTIHIALKIDDHGSIRVLQNVGKASDETGRKGKKVFDDMDQSAKSFAGSAGLSAGALLKMGAGVVGVTSVVSALKSMAIEIKNAGIQLDSLKRSFVAITGSEALAGKEMQYVNTTAKTLGLNLTALESSYKGILAASKGTALEGKAIQKVFTAVSQASAVLGLSADDTKGTLYALSQMISKGTVQSEELRGQLGERLPGAFNLAAKAMGVSTQKLGKMLEQGEVLATDLLPRLADVLTNRYGKAAEDAGKSSRAAFENLSTAVLELKRTLAESGILEILTDMVKAATAVANSLKSALAPETAEKLTAILQERKKELEKLKSGWLPAPAAVKALEFQISNLEKKIGELNQKQKESVKTIGLYAESTVAAGASQNKFTDGVEKSKKAENEYQKALAAVADEYAKLTLSAQEYQAFELEKWFNEQSKAIGGVTKELQYLYDVKKAMIEHEKKYGPSIQVSYELSIEDEAAAVKKAYEERVKASDDAEKEIRKAEEETRKNYEKLMDDQKQAYIDFSETITDNIADIIKSHESMADKIVTIFQDMLAQIVASIISQKIVIPIALQIGSASGASWNGTSFSKMAGANSGNGMGVMDMFSIGKNAYGLVNGTGNMFGVGSTIGDWGMGAFGATSWLGGVGAAVPASATGASAFGYAAGNLVGVTGAGGAAAGGMAAGAAAAIPYIGLFVAAAMLLTQMLKKEKDPQFAVHFGQDYPTLTTTTIPGGKDYDAQTISEITQKRTGSITSDFGFYVDTQKMAPETSGLVKTYFETQFEAVDAALLLNFKDVLKKRSAQAESGVGAIGTGFNLATDYKSMEEALAAANTWIARELAANFVEAYGLAAETSVADSGKTIFEHLKPEGSDNLFDAFVRFGKVMESIEDPVYKFNRQLELLGGDSLTAFLNLEKILGVFSSIDAMMDSVLKTSNPLVQIIDQFNTWIDTLISASASIDEITRAEQKRTQALGAQLTGLTAQSVSQSLQQSIISGGSFDLKQLMGSSIAAAMSNSLTGTYMAGVLADFETMVGKSFLDAGQDMKIFMEFLPGMVNRLDLSSLTAQADAFASEWQSLFGTDAQALINDRNSAAQAYLTGLQNELSILENNLNAAKSNYLDMLQDELSAQKNLVSDLQSSIRSIESFRSGTGDVGNMTLAGGKSWLNSLAASASGDDPDSISALIAGAGSYLDSVKNKTTSYVDYAMEVAATSNILQGVEDTAKDQLALAEDQITHLQSIIDEVNGVSSRIKDLDTARAAYESAKMEFDNSWMQKEVETLEGILNGIKSLAELKADYNSAQNAISSGAGASGSSGSFGTMDYYNARPDVWAAYLNNDFTKNPITADAFAKQHYTNFGKNEGTKWSFSGGGTVDGPESGYTVTATFHGRERIIPENMIGGNDDLIEEIRNLREDMRAANYQIAKNSQDTARVLRRFDDTDALLVRVVA